MRTSPQSDPFILGSCETTLRPSKASITSFRALSVEITSHMVDTNEFCTLARTLFITVTLCRPGKPKVDVEVFNWPWIADEQQNVTGDTFLQFFFSTEARLDQVGNVTAEDFGQSFELRATSKNVDIRIDFLQVATFDGVDIYSPVNEFLGGKLEFLNVQTFPSFPAILILCNEFARPILPRWSKLSWDPTLSAIFSSVPSATETPQAKSNSKTVGIAVGVSVGVVVAIAVTVTVLYVKVPAVKKLFIR